jgi:hypothetical protein
MHTPGPVGPFGSGLGKMRVCASFIVGGGAVGQDAAGTWHSRNSSSPAPPVAVAAVYPIGIESSSFFPQMHCCLANQWRK